MLCFSRAFLRSTSLYRLTEVPRYYATAQLLERFNKAVKDLNTLPEEPPNDVKLKLYALYKQATVGRCNVSKPGVFDLVGKAKWDAWNKLGDMPQNNAQEEYATLVYKLAGEAKPATAAQSQASSDSPDGLATSFENHGFIIRFNRPEKRNSITLEMYKSIIQLLKTVGERKDVHYLVLTGTGDYFSSGNDLGNFTAKLKTGVSPDQLAKDAAELVRQYVGAFIDFPKPAIALVNGPSIGVSCTILGLFDVVYASDKAYFQTPFSNLGLSPEGCSSYTFPRIMGNAKANEVLMMNKQLSAKEAKECGFVTDYFPSANFEAETKQRILEFSKLPPTSLRHSKTLVREPIWSELHKANDKECERLVERFTSEEAMKAVMEFFKDKGKL